jgi:hypothetical protein
MRFGDGPWAETLLRIDFDCRPDARRRCGGDGSCVIGLKHTAAR